MISTRNVRDDTTTGSSSSRFDDINTWEEGNSVLTHRKPSRRKESNNGIVRGTSAGGRCDDLDNHGSTGPQDGGEVLSSLQNKGKWKYQHKGQGKGRSGVRRDANETIGSGIDGSGRGGGGVESVLHSLDRVPFPPCSVLNRCLFVVCVLWMLVKVYLARETSLVGKPPANAGECENEEQTRFHFYHRIQWLVPEEKYIKLERTLRDDDKGKHPVVGSDQQPPEIVDVVNSKERELKEKKKKKKKNSRKGKRETVPDGCVPTDWQTLSFPNCNILHEIDLEDALIMKEDEESGRKEGVYIGSGHWRNVWRINDALNGTGVIKMMQMKHNVTERNFDRHRRDALTMERLTSQPYVVNAYGYCGNTVVSEYVGRKLDEVLYLDQSDDSGITRNTHEGRLRIALDVSRGLRAIHTIPGGAIVHADIGAKQFLIDPNGLVRINDFNRCRFMARNNVTGEPCPFRIASAPGLNRSPEEYKLTDLTEKLDVFSFGHVLYGILTGNRNFDKYRKKKKKEEKAKALVKIGKLPTLKGFYGLEERSDIMMVHLMRRTFELKPERRPSTSEVVTLLEELLKEQENHLENR